MKLVRKSSAFVLCLAIICTAFAFTSALKVSALNDSGLSTNQSYNVAFGCDLSYWNVDADNLNYSLVDFAKMKADGCEFAILRIGSYSSSSGYWMDDAFLQFYNNARAVGMDLGIYFYSYSTTYAGAVNDANYVISVIEKYNMYFEYPIYIDVEEDSQTSLSSAKLTSLCQGWCDTLEAAGYFPGVYGTQSTVTKLSTSFRNTYDCWMARVAANGSVGQSNQYNPNTRFYYDVAAMWQYSWYDYEYNGIGLDMLDVNVVYKDYPEIMYKYGYNNCSIPLEDIIAAAENVVYTDYTFEAVTALQEIYAEAVALSNNANATAAQRTAMAEKLQKAIDAKATATTNISAGASYTVAENPRSDGYADDGLRLADGNKSNTDGGSTGYSGFGVAAEVTLDLGNTWATNLYTVYGAYGNWGIGAPAKLTVYSSADGVNFTELAYGTQHSVISTGDWTLYTMAILIDAPVSARYIKFKVDSSASHVWLDEVEAVLAPATAASGAVYVGAVNSRIYAGDCHIFTPDFGTITTGNANHTYTGNVIAKWSDKFNAYVVSQAGVYGTGTSTADITLASDEILIAAHNWETGVSDGAVVGSEANTHKLMNAKVGDVLVLHGIDLAGQSVAPAAYISYYTPYKLGDASEDGSVNALDYQMLKRAVLGTYTLSDTQKLAGDINGDGSVNALDYQLLKRACLGTYTITEA